MAELTFSPYSGFTIRPIQTHRKFQFGDNYQQRQRIGVNPWALSLPSLVFQFSEQGKIQPDLPLLSEGISFFMEVGTDIPFEFDIAGFSDNPNLPSSASGKLQWVCNSWEPRHVSGDLWEIVVDIETWRAAPIASV